MHENNGNRIPAGLLCVLAYQCLLVIVCVAFAVRYAVLFQEYREPGFVIYIVVLSCAALAIACASVGTFRRRSGAILLSMICHWIIGLLSVIGLLGFLLLGMLQQMMAPLYFLFVLMWLPAALASGCAFYNLKNLKGK